MTLANQHEMWALICELKEPLYGRAYTLAAAVQYREEVADQLQVEDPAAYARQRRATGAASETLTSILADMDIASETDAATPTISRRRLPYIGRRMRASASLPPRKAVTLGSATKTSTSSSASMTTTQDLSVMTFVFMQVC